MLERNVNNIRNTLGRFAPELPETQFAREMWAIFEQGELKADSKLTGNFVREEPTDPDSVLLAVEDARQEALQRELGREN
jgi:RIO kinase 1